MVRHEKEEEARCNCKAEGTAGDWAYIRTWFAREGRKRQRRRWRSFISHKEWNRLMYALHGNTVQDQADAVRAVVWNTMQLAAGKDTAKRAWLAEQLDLFRPTVVVLLEVSGDFEDMKKLRKWAATLRYDMKFMVGEDTGPGGSRRNGLVALVAREQAAFKSHKRQEERVMGFVVTHKVDAATRAYVGLHGSHDKVKQAKQFDAATKFAAEHGGALLAADWNAVPCQKWRAAESKLDGCDRKLRKICGKACSCCGRDEEACCKVVGGAGGDLAEEDACVSFTRWHIAEGRWVKPTARLDFVVATGLEEGKWTLLDEVRAEWGAEEEQPRPYSDHVMIVVERSSGGASAREETSRCRKGQHQARQDDQAEAAGEGRRRHGAGGGEGGGGAPRRIGHRRGD